MTFRHSGSSLKLWPLWTFLAWPFWPSSFVRSLSKATKNVHNIFDSRSPVTEKVCFIFLIETSLTRLGDLLDFGFGQLFKAFVNLPKSLTCLDNFCIGVKSYHFSTEIIFRQLLLTFGDFFLVTLESIKISLLYFYWIIVFFTFGMLKNNIFTTYFLNLNNVLWSVVSVLAFYSKSKSTCKKIL